MRCEVIPDGFPLRINVSLLSIAIAFAVISSLSDRGNLRIICLIAGGLLTLAAVGPSLSGCVREHVRKGKPEDTNPDTIITGWKQFCQSIGIKEDIKVKVFPNLRNALANGTTIEIGRPLLRSLDSVSIKAVFAHELAHIKRKHTLKKLRLLFGVVLVSGVLFGGTLYGFGPSAPSLFACTALSIILIGFMGIAMRFISWPCEYEADLMAGQSVNQGAVVSALTAMAALKKMDVTRDFYSHPSINKRRANLGWSKKTRFRKWYIEL